MPRLARLPHRAREKAAPPPQPKLRPHPKELPHLIAIGASTGGIHALGQLLGSLSPKIQLPILVNHDLPRSFMEPFVRQLCAASGRPTVVACEGMPVTPGRIIVAPG